ncbi:unnamed protein product [Camellia sinensis]
MSIAASKKITRIVASSSADSFLQLGDDSPPAASTRSFDDPRLSSQRFDSFSNFADSESVVTIAVDDSLIYVSGGEFSPHTVELSPESNGKAFDGGYVASNGPILPPPTEMVPEQGFALSEWKRKRKVNCETNQATNREKEK